MNRRDLTITKETLWRIVVTDEGVYAFSLFGIQGESVSSLLQIFPVNF